MIEELVNTNKQPDGSVYTPLRLWSIEFTIRAIGKGCAFVKANSSADAEQILKSNGEFNGNPTDYLVTKVEEVVVPPCCGLMAEQVITYKEVMG